MSHCSAVTAFSWQQHQPNHCGISHSFWPRLDEVDADPTRSCDITNLAEAMGRRLVILPPSLPWFINKYFVRHVALLQVKSLSLVCWVEVGFKAERGDYFIPVDIKRRGKCWEVTCATVVHRRFIKNHKESFLFGQLRAGLPNKLKIHIFDNIYDCYWYD